MTEGGQIHSNSSNPERGFGLRPFQSMPGIGRCCWRQNKIDNLLSFFAKYAGIRSSVVAQLSNKVQVLLLLFSSRSCHVIEMGLTRLSQLEEIFFVSG